MLENGISDDKPATKLNPIEEDIVDLFMNQFQTFRLKDGCRKLLQLGIVFSGAASMCLCMHNRIIVYLYASMQFMYVEL